MSGYQQIGPMPAPPVKFDPVAMIGAGGRLAGELFGQPAPEDAAIVWALTMEAAEVFRRVSRPGPAGYPRKSTLPDPLVNFWEHFAILRDQAGDRVDVPAERVRVETDAGSIDRADVVLWLWQTQALKGTATRQIVLRCLWAWAAGARPAAISRRTGIGRQRLYRCREIACEQVADALDEIAQKTSGGIR